MFLGLTINKARMKWKRSQNSLKSSIKAVPFPIPSPSHSPNPTPSISTFSTAILPPDSMHIWPPFISQPRLPRNPIIASKFSLNLIKTALSELRTLSLMRIILWRKRFQNPKLNNLNNLPKDNHPQLSMPNNSQSKRLRLLNNLLLLKSLNSILFRRRKPEKANLNLNTKTKSIA
jgi:hypothetical protein